MPLTLVRNDIVNMKVDAVVNAANSALSMGGGVCGAIFEAAGKEKMQKACAAAGGCDTGKAVVTPGFGLKARYVIHAVGPVWRGGGNGEEELLKSCYAEALSLAQARGLSSVAFPLISSGVYGYPKKEALRVAVNAIRGFSGIGDMQVYLAVFDREALELSTAFAERIERYIDDHYVEQHTFASRFTRAFREGASMPPVEESQSVHSSPEIYPTAAAPMAQKISMPPSAKKAERSLKDLLKRMDETFSQMLLRLIDERGMTDVEAYRRANLDRKLFSKIRGDAQYKPSKNTALALAVALRLNCDETRDLLLRAGYALSPSSKSDVIVRFFIEEGVYDIYAINEALFAYEQNTLGV